MLKINVEAIRKELENRKDRSAWDKGVTVYAFEILDTIEEMIAYYGEAEDIATVKKYALNGASDWSAYSWGGSSLIYDSDIAKTLCNPTELKQTRNGERRPNKNEEWLDVQARALFQAYNRVCKIINRMNKGV